jgi:hypothetical protein
MTLMYSQQEKDFSYSKCETIINILYEYKTINDSIKALNN